MKKLALGSLAPACLGVLMMSGCTPTVQVAAPSEPIHINLNVRIEHEIYIRVAEELDSIFSGSSGLF
ncbi:YnbE family lipoprotein [Aliidiomarina sedimenti]|uniref:YnbE family lipoprotein n=2 Tax=Aliidiomarina TaxID=1249554 RepID=A0A432WLR6_9GAMM|nr:MULTISPECIES: YnbE family lipoprotein [Aliidiomarina]RUO32007.1 YnbE family lipoprotein [Aliidiomarina sedimenti]RUO34698.1 YnbE family lipoprotein [Aliidiomarina soli]